MRICRVAAYKINILKNQQLPLYISTKLYTDITKYIFKKWCHEQI